MARSRDFIQGPWTQETHLYVIFSAQWTPMGWKHPRWGAHWWFIINAKQHSAGFHSSPFRDHSNANSRMALFCWNKWSLEWQFWQGSLPKIILPDSTGLTGFRQESQGHDKDPLALQRRSSRSFWRDLGMSHSGMGNLPPIWLDWTHLVSGIISRKSWWWHW